MFPAATWRTKFCRIWIFLSSPPPASASGDTVISQRLSMLSRLRLEMSRCCIRFEICCTTTAPNRSRLFQNAFSGQSPSLFDLPCTFLQGEPYGGCPDRWKYPLFPETRRNGFSAGFPRKNPAPRSHGRRRSADGYVSVPAENDACL